MQSSVMSPAQQYQPSQSIFPGSFSLPHPSFPYNYNPAKFSPISASHFSPEVGRGEPWSSHSQISSPASLDSTGDTGSSPTSPLSPSTSRGEGWQYQHAPFFNSNFPPPNTVAPPPSLHKYQPGLPQHNHRPDAVFGGGGHRGAMGPLRPGLEMVPDNRETYTARHYGGSANTVAPPTPSTSSSSSSYHNNMVHSPGPYSRAGSCSSYGSMMSPSESQLSVQVTEIVQQLGMSQEDLILKSTRDLNKLLKVGGTPLSSPL